MVRVRCENSIEKHSGADGRKLRQVEPFAFEALFGFE